MAEIRFPSIAEPDKRAYIYDTMAYHSRPPVSEHLLFYETYGDGLTQHSGAWPIGVPLFTDYLFSLVAYLLEHNDAISVIGWQFHAPVNPDAVTFAASVKFDPEEKRKERYYSLELQKTGLTERLRNDRRYERVEPWMDGTPEAVARMFYKDYNDPLRTFALLNAVRDYFLSHPGSQPAFYAELPTLESEADTRQRQEWHSAWDAIQTTCRALELLNNARSRLDNYKHKVESVQEVAS